MNMNQLAQIVEGLNAGLGESLKKADAAELSSLVDLCRSFQEVPVSQFVDFVEKFRTSANKYPGRDLKNLARFVEAMVEMKAKYPNKSEKSIVKAVQQAFISVEEVTERIKSFPNGQSESVAEITSDLQLLSAPKVKEVLTHVGLTPATKKADNVKMLEDHLKSNGQIADKNGTGQKPAVNQKAVEQAVNTYRNIQENLRELSWEQIDREFETISRQDEDTVREVARQLGFTTLTGSRGSILDGLMNSLRKQKRTLMQTEYV